MGPPRSRVTFEVGDTFLQHKLSPRHWGLAHRPCRGEGQQLRRGQTGGSHGVFAPELPTSQGPSAQLRGFSRLWVEAPGQAGRPRKGLSPSGRMKVFVPICLFTGLKNEPALSLSSLRKEKMQTVIT